MSTIRPFNTSSKDPTSFRLRNPQLSSKESERLDTDNYKMEAKLRELKLNMKRQKQERENMHSDGSIWSSGKPGAVTMHGSDLLKKEPSKPSQAKGKARKIKVLKDTPLDLPKRKPISTSFAEPSPPKFKGPACGQCEQKAVALTCMECGENYCTSCFAKFHLKGALKNHRSIPYQIKSSSSSSSSLDLSNGMTPSPKSSAESLPPRPPSASRRTTTSSDASDRPVKTIPVKMKEPSQTTGGAFLQGTFSEEESAQSFAQALAEWRAGKDDGKAAANTPPATVKQVESIASGTSTEEEEPKAIEINFSSDTSITYADKLLIKKHRRTELSPLPSPRLTSPGAGDTVRRSQDSGEIVVNGHADAIYDDEGELREEHERYAGIFDKVGAAEEPRLESALSIVEVTEDPTPGAMEVESAYSVEEIDGVHVASPYGNLRSSVHPQHPSSAGEDAQASPPARPRESPPAAPSAATVSSSRKPAARVETAGKTERAAARSALGGKTPAEKRPKQQQQQQQRDAAPRMASARPASQRRPPPSRESRDKPRSAGPAKRAGRGPVLGAGPAGRDESGRSSGLTSAPSGELVSTGQLAKQSLHRYTAGLGDFFLAGLPAEEGGGRGPMEDADSREGSSTPVNRLPECTYRGAMSAWRPDSSLAAAAPLALREDLQAFSPSPPPPKSGRHSRRAAPAAAAKPRPLHPPATGQAPPVLPAEAPPRRDADGKEDDGSSTISWRLSRQGQRGGEGRKDNHGTEPDKDPESRDRGLPHPDRSSSRIEVDGDDMTVYDDAGKDNTDAADEEALDQLTWELASQSGRLTADGRLTSMSLPDEPAEPAGRIYRDNSFSQDEELGIREDAGLGSGLSTPYDFETGRSITPTASGDEEEEGEDDAFAMEIQRYTAEVEALD